MSIEKTKAKLIKLLLDNGWKLNENSSEETVTFNKDNSVRVDIEETEIIIFYGKDGKITQSIYFDIDSNTYYTVLGYFLFNRILPVELKVWD